MEAGQGRAAADSSAHSRRARGGGMPMKADLIEERRLGDRCHTPASAGEFTTCLHKT